MAHSRIYGFVFGLIASHSICSKTLPVRALDFDTLAVNGSSATPAPVDVSPFSEQPGLEPEHYLYQGPSAYAKAPGPVSNTKGALSFPRFITECNRSACFEYDIDYCGSDILKVEDGSVRHPKACQQLCAQTRGCAYWTFIPESSWCYLKHKGALQGRSCRRSAISGPRVCPSIHKSCYEHDIGFKGCNLKIQGHGVHSAEECHLLCLAFPRCQYWTWVSSYQSCYMKDEQAVHRRVYQPGSISGPRMCVPVPPICPPGQCPPPTDRPCQRPPPPQCPPDQGPSPPERPCPPPPPPVDPPCQSPPQTDCPCQRPPPPERPCPPPPPPAPECPRPPCPPTICPPGKLSPPPQSPPGQHPPTNCPCPCSPTDRPYPPLPPPEYPVPPPPPSCPPRPCPPPPSDPPCPRPPPPSSPPRPCPPPPSGPPCPRPPPPRGPPSPCAPPPSFPPCPRPPRPHCPGDDEEGDDTQGCYDIDAEVQGHDIDTILTECGARGCQRLCQKHRKCMAFTYFQLERKCILKSQYGSFAEKQTAVAGPKYCFNSKCVKKDVEYYGNLLTGSTEPSLGECHKRCQINPFCAAVTYVENIRICQQFSLAFSNENRTSGPKICTPRYDRDSGSAGAPAPAVVYVGELGKVLCHDPAVVYTSKPFSALHVLSAEICQNMCREEVRCKYFTYFLYGKVCLFHDTEGQRVSNITAVSGPNVCPPSPCFLHDVELYGKQVGRCRTQDMLGCQKACLRNKSCQFFVFHRHTRLCIQKQLYGPRPGATSAPLHCGAPEEEIAVTPRRHDPPPGGPGPHDPNGGEFPPAPATPGYEEDGSGPPDGREYGEDGLVPPVMYGEDGLVPPVMYGEDGLVPGPPPELPGNTEIPPVPYLDGKPVQG